MSHINGIHHFMLKCRGYEQFCRVVSLYRDSLGLKVARAWGEGDNSAIMLDTGAGLIEIFANADDSLPMGVIRHIALATTDTDACVEAARADGCAVRIEPKDIVIPSEPPYPARIAFVIGHLGEEIEFFQVK